jgi:flavin-dependent dehydrogenase
MRSAPAPHPFWEPGRRSGYPGYGWIFPGQADDGNVSLGVGARGDRRVGARASKELAAFVAAMGLDPSLVGRTVGG